MAILDIYRTGFRLCYPTDSTYKVISVSKVSRDLSLKPIESELSRIFETRGQERAVKQLIILLPDSEFTLNSAEFPSLTNISYAVLKVSLKKILATEPDSLYLHYRKVIGRLTAIGISKDKVEHYKTFLKRFGIKLVAVLPKSWALFQFAPIPDNMRGPEIMGILIDTDGLYLNTSFKGFPLFSSNLPYPIETFERTEPSDPVLLKLQMDLSRIFRSYSVNYHYKLNSVVIILLGKLENYPGLKILAERLELPVKIIECDPIEGKCQSYLNLLRAKSLPLRFTYNQLQDEQEEEVHRKIRVWGTLTLLLLALIGNYILSGLIRAKRLELESQISQLQFTYDTKYHKLKLDTEKAPPLYSLVKAISELMPDGTYIQALEFKDGKLVISCFSLKYEHISELSKRLKEISSSDELSSEVKACLTRRMIKQVSADNITVQDIRIPGYRFKLEVPASGCK